MRVLGALRGAPTALRRSALGGSAARALRAKQQARRGVGSLPPGTASALAGIPPAPSPQATRRSLLTAPAAYPPPAAAAVPLNLPPSLKSWATLDPETMSGSNPARIHNLLRGEWVHQDAHTTESVPDPLTGEPFILMPHIAEEELGPYIDSMKSCPKHGLHNPIGQPQRYLMLGEVSQKIAQRLSDPEVAHYFARLIQRVCPKSYGQASGEVSVTRAFLYNFSGDQVRFLAQSFGTPGDHPGQTTQGYRWPYGPVAIISPFNFPLEIPVLQLMGALYMGNRPTLKPCHRVSVVMEQFIRLLHDCGLPKGDIDLISTSGSVMESFLVTARPRMTQFTGSTRIAERLTRALDGKVKIEGGGFDWKVLGPDVPQGGLYDMVAYQCDQDAYACSGQKCSAMSILFMHDNWANSGLLTRLSAMAGTRSLGDLTVGPTLSVPPHEIKAHLQSLLSLPGSRLLWGGEDIEGGNHTIPDCYGAMQPTAVFVPLETIMASEEAYAKVSKECFAPIYVITQFGDSDIPTLLDALERMDEHLTAGVVSNDPQFQHAILANSLNGTTYVGMRARTTGAPQNHWFGPAGDPRSAGIGTSEAIRYTWSGHREIITDVGVEPVGGFKIPEQS
uniref:Aldehyde dehydrogenase domain-containing protein n=1 Tax=Hemiselmis tepida TaxID=464990 RepID=A0A6T6Y3B1_9CRYP|mmetsp:Transcript_9054/g.23784  ORF Transcript_9054/g.23784 Transcript_9054/m.23784 type:complete len:618 (+) Transcript_9054:189-2042(+)